MNTRGCGGRLTDGLRCAPADLPSPGERPWRGETARGVQGVDQAGITGVGHIGSCEGGPGGTGLGVNAKVLTYLLRLGWSEG